MVQQLSNKVFSNFAVKEKSARVDVLLFYDLAVFYLLKLLQPNTKIIKVLPETYKLIRLFLNYDFQGSVQLFLHCLFTSTI